MSRRPPLFRATDLARALRAGAMAGVSVRVAITKDGALTVSPMPAEAPKAADANEWEKAIGKAAIPKRS